MLNDAMMLNQLCCNSGFFCRDYSEDIGEEPAQIPSVLIDATEQTPVETVEAPPAKRPRTSKNRKETEGSRQQSCACQQVQEIACAWSMSTGASKMTYFLYSHAGQSASHEAVAQACMEHLAQLKEHKTTNKRDDIAYFALRTDARLRALPIHVAQDLMHLMESMIYQAEVENRNTSN
nr:uncharacterized protein LOC129381315 [Dermacentor andersoni]